MKKITVCVFFSLLGALARTHATQTRVSFTILPGTGDNNTDTGYVDTGSTDTGTTTTGSTTTGVVITTGTTSGGGGGLGNAGGGIGGGNDIGTGKILGSASGTETTGNVIVPSTGEFADVYAWAHHFGLIENRNVLYGTLTRVQFAKIITLFVKNIRGESISSNSACAINTYSDYRKISAGDRQYVKSACDIGIMGWNGDRTSLLPIYNPYGIITRDQMATIISRILYGTKYDNTDTVNRYQGHLMAIFHAGFIGKLDPKIVESRYNILTILQRIATVIAHGKVSPYKGQTQKSTAAAPVDQELQSAYAWAKTNSITTMVSYDEATLYTPLTRGELARMIVIFSENILNTPSLAINICPIAEYTDYSTMSDELLPYIQEACDRGIMGRGSDQSYLTAFRPSDIVTRAEFGTVLARILYDNKYDTSINTAAWYQPSLDALQSDGYLSKANTPFMAERYGYVMLIMKRIAEKLVK